MSSLPKIPAYAPFTAAELPKPRAAWQLQAGRAALLVHDMQAYFASAFAPQAPQLETAVANIAQLLAHCRQQQIPVFYTAQHGNQDRRDRGLQADLWGPGMRALAEHETILEPLAPAKGDFVLTKHRYSAFQRSNLEQLLRVRQRDQLIITGVYAHIGCMLTAAEAFQRDIEPFFIADALADFSREKHALAIDWVAATCGVPLATQQALERLGT